MPGAGDAVTISNGHAVTVDAPARSAGSLTIATGATATSLTLATNLTVTNASGGTGNVNINASTANVTRTIAVGTNTLTVTGNVNVQGGNTTGGAANISQLTVTSGIATIGGALNIAAGNTVQNIARATLTTGRISITGNTTVTGGTAANHDALLSVTGASAVGNGVIIGGDLSVVSTVSGSSTVSITASGGRITVNGATGVTNGDTVTVGQGIFTVAADYSTTNTSIVTTTTVATPGQLNVTGNVTVQGGSIASSSASITGTTGTIAIGGNATVAGGSVNASSATLSVTTGSLTIDGDLSITGGTVATSNATVSVSSGIVTLTGNATLSGFAANRTALLSVTAAPAVAGNGINIGGDLTINSAQATRSTVSITAANGVFNVAGNVTNGDTITVGSGIFSATGAGKTFATTNTSIASSTTVAAGGQLNITGNLTVTGGSLASSAASVTGTTGSIAVTGNATVTGGSFNPSGATLSVTNTTGNLTVSGDLSINGGTATNSNALVSVGTGTITVAGDTTVTGRTGATGGTATLSATAAPAGAGTGINLTGSAKTLSVVTTAAGGVASGVVNLTGGGVLNCAGDVANGGTVTIQTGTFNLTKANATYANSSAVVVATTTITTGSLNLSGDTATLSNAAGDTMSISTTGAITVGNTTTYTGTLTNAGTLTLSAGGTVNANGTFTNSGTFTNTAAGQLFLRGAASTVNGTFNRGTGTVTMNGGAAQNLSGSALTPIAAGTGLNNLTIDNASGVTIGSTVSVNATTTFTTGNVITGGNTLIAVPNCAASVSRTSGHVVGNLRKTIPAGASTCTFEIGSGANYTPAVLAFVAGTTAGNITASTTGAEHGSIGSSAINPARSVNRYWTLTNGGVTVPAAGFTATFNFINGSPVDYDAIADPTKFFVQRFSGGWTTSTLNATCVATPGTNLCEQVNGLTVAAGFGDFAIGEANYTGGNAGWFNVFETVTGVGIAGNIYTKIVGTGISVDVVAVNSTRTGVQPGYNTNPITVDLLNASDNSGAINAETDCRASWALVLGQSFSLSPTWTSSRATIAIPAQASALKEGRIRVTQGTLVGCSTDNFTIRPGDFAISSTNATNAGTSGTPIFKAGTDSFNLKATSVAGYTGTPLVDNTAGMVVGTPNQGTITGSFGAPVAGVADGNFTYSEVGNFGLAANAVHDDSFVVDTAPGDCTADFSTSLVGGKYGCKIGSAAVAVGSGFGRFIPDNFGVSTNTPSFTTGCGTFSYVGKTFAYGTAPAITVTARNGSNATTTNYAGAYMKLTNASLTPATQAARYSRFDALGGGTTPALDLTGLPAPAGDPAIGTFTNGVGTLTFSSGTGLLFTRSTTTPSAPFNADVAISLNVIDTDNVAFAGNPAAFGSTAVAGNGMTFSGGKGMRFGRLRMQNASGSEKLDLPISTETQYWTGSVFATNSADGCTSLNAANLSLGSYTDGVGGIDATNLGASHINTGGTFASGVGNVKLTKPSPTPTKSGAATLTVNLTAESKTYLKGNWGVATFTADPSARASFGTFSAQPRNFIFFRENY